MQTFMGMNLNLFQFLSENQEWRFNENICINQTIQIYQFKGLHIAFLSSACKRSLHLALWQVLCCANHLWREGQVQGWYILQPWHWEIGLLNFGHIEISNTALLYTMCLIIIILEEIAFLYSSMKAYHYVAHMTKTIHPFNWEKPLVSLHMAVVMLLSLNNICHLHLYSLWWWWILMIIINKDLN